MLTVMIQLDKPDFGTPRCLGVNVRAMRRGAMTEAWEKYTGWQGRLSQLARPFMRSGKDHLRIPKSERCLIDDQVGRLFTPRPCVV